MTRACAATKSSVVNAILGVNPADAHCLSRCSRHRSQPAIQRWSDSRARSAGHSSVTAGASGGSPPQTAVSGMIRCTGSDSSTSSRRSSRSTIAGGRIVRQRVRCRVGRRLGHLRRGPPGAAVVGLVPEDQRDVHVPGPQHPQRLRRLRLGQPQVEAGMAVVQDRRRGRHDGAEGRGERRQPQPSGPQPGEDHQLVLGRVEAADDLDRPLGQQPPRIRQPDAAPGPLDQLGARLRLEPGQVVADRRLRVVQRVRRRRHRAVPGHGDEDAEPGHVEHAPDYRRYRLVRPETHFGLISAGRQRNR